MVSREGDGLAGRDAVSGMMAAMKVVTVTWQPTLDRFEAHGTHRGQHVLVNAPHDDGPPTGFSASELLLASAGSCSAWDVVEILRKRRQSVTGVQVEVQGEQAPEHPKAFVRVSLVYRVSGQGLNRTAVERAVELSAERYCPVIATIRGVAEVSTRIELRDALAAEPAPEAPEETASTPG
jgi:putative redox protein